MTRPPDRSSPGADTPTRPRGLRRLLGAQLVSNLGDGVTGVALPLLVLGTAGIGATGLVFVVAALPGLLLGLHGGVVADRVDRQRLVVLANAGRGLLLLGVPALYDRAGVAAVAVLAFLSSALGVLERPATRAALPSLAGDRFPSFVGHRAALAFLATAIGPAAGGALVGLVGAPTAILADAVSFLIAAAVVATIPDFDRTRAERALARAEHPAPVLRDLVGGLRGVLGNPVARGLLGYWFVNEAAVPIALLAAIPYVTVTLGQSPFRYGLAVSCFAVGSIVSSLGSGRLSSRAFQGRRRRWLLAAGTTYGAVNLVMLAEPGFALFCVLWLVWGLSYGPEEVIGQTLFAEAVPDALRGRAYSVLGVVLGAATVAGYAGAGVLVGALGSPRAMALAGVLFVLATVWAFGYGALGSRLARTDRGG